MKRSATATTRSRRPSGVSVSLFPFLAVLICTMGALIVLLVVITRQAQVQAAHALVAEKTQKQQDLEAASQMARYRIAELKVSREKTESQLAEVRLQLGNLEDHARQLREQIARLETAWSQLESVQKGNTRQREEIEAQIAKLKDEIAQAASQLAEDEKGLQKRASYAVVPYEGPNGTHRRPIYIECRRDGVVLQPEGVVLSEVDFDGPLGPGNPLDVALRATREYLLQRGQIAADGSNEPYPLLLVRPGGIEAYYAAREAMKSWASDFGYEMIGEDWQLEFQPSDATLADTVKQVVEVARVRQQRLARAVPRHYENRSRPKYRPAPFRGGVVRDDGGTGGDGDGGSGSPESAAARFGNRYRGDSSNTPAQPARYEGVLTGGPSGDATSAGNPGGSPSQDGAVPQLGQVAGQNGSMVPGGQQGSTGASGSMVPGGQAGSTGASGSPVQASPDGATPAPGQVSLMSPSEQSGTKGVPARPGEWIPQSPSQSPPPTQEPAGEAHADDQTRCLAKIRGENWGLRDAASGSVPITRPIRVDLYADRLVIVPEKGVSAIKVIPLGSRTEDAVDGMISTVWELMDAWGIAGRGMYWRPTLSVYVVSGAETRYNDLAMLLDGSGLEVKRK